MGDGYYPKYYHKKKQRDQIYLIIWRVVLFLGAGIALGAFLFFIFPMSRKTNGLAELAVQKEELEVARDIDQAKQGQNETGGSQVASAPDNAVTLSDVGYISSQPAVHVAINGLTPSESRDPHIIDDDLGTASQQSPDSEPTTSTPTDSASDSPTESDRLPRGNPEPQNSSGEQESGSAAGQSATANDSPASQPDEEPKPAEEPKEEPKVTPKPTGVTVYKVFAGYYDSKDEAVSRKKDLSTLGFSGTVQEGAGTYSIFVSEFEDSDKAKALENKLEQSGFKDSFVVRAKN